MMDPLTVMHLRRQWRSRAALARFAGEPLRITEADYAELVELKLAPDVLDDDERKWDLFGVPLVVE